MGNFDGVGKRDALCADIAGSKWINYDSGKKWYKKSSWCTHPGSRIYAVKLNKDKRVDLRCRDSRGGDWKKWATEFGEFNF